MKKLVLQLLVVSAFIGTQVKSEISAGRRTAPDTSMVVRGNSNSMLNANQQADVLWRMYNGLGNNTVSLNLINQSEQDLYVATNSKFNVILPKNGTPVTTPASSQTIICANSGFTGSSLQLYSASTGNTPNNPSAIIAVSNMPNTPALAFFYPGAATYNIGIRYNPKNQTYSTQVLPTPGSSKSK